MQYKIKTKNTMLLPEECFSIGQRVGNKKRNFLFISKIIGKHLETDPESIIKVGRELAQLVRPSSKNALCIGFAETATGIGLATANALACQYISTTRAVIDEPNFSFEEEHSHASTHYCYGLIQHIGEFDEILLIDDELTTGNTILNIISQLKQFTGVKTYRVLSILDWRSDKNVRRAEEFSRQNKLEVSFASLFSGTIDSNDNRNYPNFSHEIIKQPFEGPYIMASRLIPNRNGYADLSGRFYLNRAEVQWIMLYAHRMALDIHESLSKEYQDILILGHGENIYLPAMIAYWLKKYRNQVSIKTTTQSPIYCDGTIKTRHDFYDRNDCLHYLYNKAEMEAHDTVVFISEANNIRDIEIPMLTDNMCAYFTCASKGSNKNM